MKARPKTNDIKPPDAGSLLGTSKPGPTPPPPKPERPLSEYFGEGDSPPKQDEPKPGPEPAESKNQQKSEAVPDLPEIPAPKKGESETAQTGAAEETREVPKPKPAQPGDVLSDIEQASQSFQTPKALREAYTKLKEEHAVMKQSYEDMLKKLEAKVAQLSDALKYADYSKSPEYEEKYVKPIKTRLENTIKLVKKLPVMSGERFGTPEDVEELYALWLRNPAQALSVAKERFDAAAQLVLDQVAGIAEANEAATSALEEFRKDMSEREAKRTARLHEIWSETIKTETEKRPDLFKFDEDAELAPIAKKYAEFADAAFLGNPELAPEELVRIQALVRTMAAAFGPIAHDRARLKQRVADLENELSNYKKSGPTASPGEAAAQRKKEKKVGLEALDEYLS